MPTGLIGLAVNRCLQGGCGARVIAGLVFGKAEQVENLRCSRREFEGLPVDSGGLNQIAGAVAIERLLKEFRGFRHSFQDRALFAGYAAWYSGRVLKLTYLGLGSNIGDRERQLKNALAALESPGLKLLRVSPIYETEPVENTKQGWFLNLVVEVECHLFPQQLLSRTMRVERGLKRTRTTPKGPRTIDVDILLMGNTVLRTPGLELPHPRMATRRFVLQPLADLAPNFRHPVTRQTIAEMLEKAPAQIVRRVHDGALDS